MHASIGALLQNAAQKYADKTAVIFGDCCWSFRELDAAASRVAHELQSLGVAQGEAVSLYSPNCPEWIIAYYGVLKLGAIVNPLNLMLTSEEAAFAMGDCGAVAVIGAPDKLAALTPVLHKTKLRHRIAFGGATADGAVAFQTWIDGDAPAWTIPGIEPDAASTIAYTSGTTGHPKGAVLTHRGILHNTAMTATLHVRTSSDVVVSALPCSHVYGNIVMNAAIAYGMTLVLHQTFDASRILASIAQHRATVFEGVPTMYLYLLDSPELARTDLSSLRCCTVGGQTMAVPRMEEVVRRFGCPLIELWGMTELGGLGTTHPVYGEPRLGSIGVPLPHLQARFVATDESRQVLSPGQIGELQIRGPVTMREYLSRPEATAQTLSDDGWLSTGDVGYEDEAGYLFVVDRLKDMIITAGFNIYPAELERVIAEHPAVSAVAVAGVSDELKGEVAKAYIVLRPGAEAEAPDIEQHCRERLAAYKVPKAWQFVADLPKTSSGKILRRKLREAG